MHLQRPLTPTHGVDEKVYLQSPLTPVHGLGHARSADMSHSPLAVTPCLNPASVRRFCRTPRPCLDSDPRSPRFSNAIIDHLGSPCLGSKQQEEVSLSDVRRMLMRHQAEVMMKLNEMMSKQQKYLQDKIRNDREVCETASESFSQATRQSTPAVDPIEFKQIGSEPSARHSVHTAFTPAESDWVTKQKTIDAKLKHARTNSMRGTLSSKFNDVVARARQDANASIHGGFKGMVTKVVNHPMFDNICAALIVMNGILLGVTTDITARKCNPFGLPLFLKHLGRVLSVCFMLELCLRMIAHGITRFFVGVDWTWNIFDLVVVTLDLVETCAELFFGDKASGLETLTALRMLRVLRIARTIRVIRLIRFFKELRMMVYSVMSSGVLLLWSMVMLAIVLFVFSVYFTQIVTLSIYYESASLSNDTVNNLQTNFGSLMYATYVLFLCISGGISWGEVSSAILEIHWSNGLVFVFYIFFTIFSVLNIISGIFVDIAIKSAQADRHEQIQEAVHAENHSLLKMQEFFEEADVDKSGDITLEELNHRLEDPKMRAQLLTLGIEAHDAAGIFNLLDVDRSGEVNIQEFIFGCLQMKGTAKSIDIMRLLNEQKRLGKRMATLSMFLKERLP